MLYEGYKMRLSLTQCSPLYQSAQGSEDCSRPHLFVLVTLMTLEECGWVRIFLKQHLDEA